MCACNPHRLWAVLLTAAVLAVAPALAGEAGHLVGRVTDEEGNAITGARLTMTGPSTAGVRTTVTDADGRFRLIAMDAVRPVDLLVEADGKIAVEYQELRVRPDRLTRVDVRLRGDGTPDILVLIDPRVPYHRMALDGARSVLPGRLQLLEVTEASPSWRRDLVRALEASPSAILAIGENAATAARSFARDVPIVHCMVPDPHPEELGAGNLCGVPLIRSFERQVARLVELDPSVRTIGTLYDPSRLSDAIVRFRRAAASAGLVLVAGQVHGPADVPRALDDLAREDPDAFVVLIDPEVYTASTFERVRRFAEDGDRLLIVPDPSMALLEKSFTLGPGFRDSGIVAARFVKQIVEGRIHPPDIGLCEPVVTETAAVAPGSIEPAGRLEEIAPPLIVSGS